jgi:hypothetical protein
MNAPALTGVERAILDILARFPGDEVPGRQLRGLLRSRGFRRSAPALVFTMMSLADKGLVFCREESGVVDGVEVRDRYYSSRGDA